MAVCSSGTEAKLFRILIFKLKSQFDTYLVAHPPTGFEEMDFEN